MTEETHNCKIHGIVTGNDFRWCNGPKETKYRRCMICQHEARKKRQEFLKEQASLNTNIPNISQDEIDAKNAQIKIFKTFTLTKEVKL